MMVMVLAGNSNDSLGALGNPHLRTLACLLSNSACLALGSGGCSGTASEGLIFAVGLGLSTESDQCDDEKLLKHMIFKIFIIICSLLFFFFIFFSFDADY